MAAIPLLLAQRARRDRVQIPLWLAACGILTWVAHIGVVENFPAEADRSAIVQTVVANPVILVFRGLPSGSHEDAFAMFLVFPWLMVMVSLMGIFLAVRHTRGDEETGRAELVGATTAGRRSPLVATTIFGASACAAAGVVVTGILLGCGYEAGGSALAGASVASVGSVYFAVALCAGQLMTTARAASSTAVWLLLTTFLLRGAGHALGTPNTDLTRVDPSGLSLSSPFGWAERGRPFDADSWPWLLLCLGAALVLVILAWVLHAHRDIGGAFVPERQGRRHAPALLNSSVSLVWRLSRGALLGWVLGAFLVGMLTTGLSSAIDGAGTEVPAVEQMLRLMGGQQSANREMIIIFSIVTGVLAACCGVQTLCRARQEENHGTAETVRAAAVGRVWWLSGFLIVAAVGGAGVVLSACLGSALGAIWAGDGDLFRDAVIAIGGQVPAAAVFMGISVLAFVLLPRATIPLSWGIVLVALCIALFGPLLEAPDWLTSSSPFAVSPIPTDDGVDRRGLWTLLSIAAFALTLALLTMRRRETVPAG
jgi:ABC-2 type transport system permease protein